MYSKGPMIWCEIPLNYINYICYELNIAYQERNHTFVLRSSRKSMNGNSAQPVILLFLFCRCYCNHQTTESVPCALERHLWADSPERWWKVFKYRAKNKLLFQLKQKIIWWLPSQSIKLACFWCFLWNNKKEGCGI